MYPPPTPFEGGRPMPNETTEAVRSAIEDRATYLFFLLKEMEKALGQVHSSQERPHLTLRPLLRRPDGLV